MAVEQAGPDRVAYALPGLTAPAEILVDRWGVPHIYAASTYDAFRVQGFNAARDRLWQIDFWRRRGLGRLAEVFGAEHVERDRAARLFLYRGDMRQEWLAYGSDTKRASTAFVEGVNAYVAMTRTDPTLLPVEFATLGYEPAFWEPEDVARIRSHGLFYNVRDEVARARTLRDLPAGVEELRRRREPWRPVEIPEGLDLATIPDDVLAVYDLATSAPAFTPPPATGPLPEGSNNWVVAGSRTRSGRPLLANDPHRTTAVLPSLRYIAHLSAPGFDVIGGGEPALPGISIGHNGLIAFGLTIFAIDQEDLYVYETDPDDPTSYRYDGRWEPMRRVEETIAVRDGEPVVAELLFTRHGPVIRQEAGRAFAVRAAWLEPGMAPYLGSMDYMRAGNWDQFAAAMNRWGAPPENQVYADPSGTIAWQTGGLTPIRPNWDGTLPVPGDGRYEWAGFHDADQLPGDVDPERGFIATANECNLPADFPPDRHITYDWYAPFRRHRLEEVLAGATDATPASMVALQSDVTSIPARRILDRARAAGVPDDVDGWAMLAGWDAVLTPESGAAALFEIWYRRHLRPELLRRSLEPLVGADRAGEVAARIAPAEDLLADARVDLDLIDGRSDAEMADLVAVTLPGAVAELTERLGADRDVWAWGSLHVAHPQHPLRPLLDGAVAPDRLASGPAPRGGSGDTVGNTAYGPSFVQTSGATFRIVVDVGEWDSSLAMNAPGQSGRLDDPHLDDLFEPWSRGEAFPLLYSRERVEAETETVIELTPEQP